MGISFEGKVVVVTGATGLIGGAMARAFYGCGAFVAICDISKEKCDSFALSLGDRAAGFAMDQRSTESVNKAFKEIIERFSKIDVLMNNAGVNIPQDARRVIRDFFDDKFEWMIDVDLHGMLRCTRAVLPYMMERKSGCIINTSSVNATIPLRNQCAFPAAKNAVNVSTKALAMEYAPYGIRVNAIAPGSTPFENSAEWEKIMHNDQNKVLIEHIPMGRQAKANEIAQAGIYLASEELASYCTGQIIAVDGGWTAGITFPY